ncbi:DUF7521 family protein [Candidatus Nitrosarchaeum limnium]|jgi:hypothetical protein|uniref:Uncharacterized protein n=1 Tax=Candidatus Nitrosarchaeum limnium SFB1 TaxID=886738 RepID=F3KJC7_9ARCH|nr:hypothetical protein [Candidatus Nitrosarchaeum limnium]EGG42405.1 Hypothetical protein Nlim_0586 [Candidatus Nitrosarchaeum limnium SFB1]
MVEELHYAILIVHLIAGLVLVYLAIKAFKKTKYPPMALLAIGFSLIVIGDTIIGDYMEFLEQGIFGEVLTETIEILGFVVLILAVKRS